jgi:hypothetical protein
LIIGSEQLKVAKKIERENAERKIREQAAEVERQAIQKKWKITEADRYYCEGVAIFKAPRMVAREQWNNWIMTLKNLDKAIEMNPDHHHAIAFRKRVFGECGKGIINSKDNSYYSYDNVFSNGEYVGLNNGKCNA